MAVNKYKINNLPFKFNPSKDDEDISFDLSTSKKINGSISTKIQNYEKSRKLETVLYQKNQLLNKYNLENSLCAKYNEYDWNFYVCYSDRVEIHNTNFEKQSEWVPSNFDNLTYLDTDPNSDRLFVWGDVFTLQFDGSATSVSIPNHNLINTGAEYTEKTIELRFKTSDDISTRQVLWEEGGTVRGLNIYIDSGNIYINGWNMSDDDSGATTPWGPLNVSTTIESNSFYHVTLVFSYTDGKILGYLNGNLFGEVTGVGKLFTHAGGNGIGFVNFDTYFHDGSFSGNGYYYFKGNIYDVRYWNIVRTQTEIQSTIYDYLNGDETGLGAYWKLNEGEGTDALDSTSNNIDGTISTPIWESIYRLHLCKTNLSPIIFYDYIKSELGNINSIAYDQNSQLLYLLDYYGLIYSINPSDGTKSIEYQFNDYTDNQSSSTDKYYSLAYIDGLFWFYDLENRNVYMMSSGYSINYYLDLEKFLTQKVISVTPILSEDNYYVLAENGVLHQMKLNLSQLWIDKLESEIMKNPVELTDIFGRVFRVFVDEFSYSQNASGAYQIVISVSF